MKRFFTLSAILLVGFQFGAPSVKAQNIFLAFAGVKGSANVAPTNLNLIEVQSAGVSTACANCTVGSATGSGGGKVTEGKFVFNLADGQALIAFRKLLYMQTPTTGSVCFAFRKTGGAAGPGSASYFYISLGQVKLLEIDESHNAGSPSGYQISLAYGQIQYTFKPQNPDGALGSPITTGWDFVKNAALSPALTIPSGL